jgi:hypothetical protein
MGRSADFFHAKLRHRNGENPSQRYIRDTTLELIMKCECVRLQPQLVIGGKVVSEGPFWFGSGPQSGIACVLAFSETKTRQTSPSFFVLVLVTCRMVSIPSTDS